LIQYSKLVRKIIKRLDNIDLALEK
jgi:hypothetical protein